LVRGGVCVHANPLRHYHGMVLEAIGQSLKKEDYVYGHRFPS
jgi:hypothetical protein